MKHRAKPILFSGPMVVAILDGRKTQTRRVGRELGHEDMGPYGSAGAKLWVRETWACNLADHPPDGYPLIHYRADGLSYHTDGIRVEPRPSYHDVYAGPWRPSIFMPRWASRATLVIADVRLERLQDISNNDAEREGFAGWKDPAGESRDVEPWEEFRDMWQKINGSRAPWESNPWVWVVAFSRSGE